MITTFHLPADNLNLAILKSIKEAFKGKMIEIIVSDTNDAETTNDGLFARIENIKNNVNLVSFTEEEFFTKYRKKIADATN